nr:AAA family ATPase [uncultured Actinoplanes sp.]
MDQTEVFPSRDPPVSAEVLHASERTRITRLFLPGRTVIRKEPLGPDAQRRLRQELAMLDRLRGIPGVAQLVDEPRYPGSLSLADVAGTELAATATPLDVDTLIRLATALAQATAGMHSRLVMHRDITPANIVIDRDGNPWLIDFALATTFAQIRPTFTHHSDIVGTLTYLAPEQTGRTGRPVDQRADLYALGATLYELATGAPPFGSSDPLRLTHDHLARIPVPPAELNPALPATLSEIILHLLEKEPDNRYQTAEGVVHDLQQLRDAGTRPATGPGRIGQHDIPLRLLPPSRLVGRDADVATLQVAFDDALAGRCRAVLVSGTPGVGKTALADELRPIVTRTGGWFVAGKFDQYRRDLEASGVYKAFRTLGRLLLAEPDDELAEVRHRIRTALGPNASLMAAVIPEYATLLAVPPDPGDPLTAQERGQRNGVQILRSVISPQRPVVLFLDDVQWAGRTPLGFLDLLLDEEPIEGLLLVISHREHGSTSADPPAASLSRWRHRTGVRQLRLDNLPPPSQITMVAEMLHADPAAATDLARMIEPHTSGNPYETVELLNALRRDGVLTATVTGWRWDPDAVREHLNRLESGRLLTTPVAALPARSRHLVEAMACLGGRATLNALHTAIGAPPDVMPQLLGPAFDEDVLVVEPGTDEAVRFRHDRIHEAILPTLSARRRHRLQLAMARRLARVPEFAAVAAEQYLPVVDAIDDPAERRRVVALLRDAAGHAGAVGDHTLVSALLGAALTLADRADTATLVDLYTGRQTALYTLGRLDEADEDYRAIERLHPTCVQRAAATAVQIRSLTNRTRFTDAVDLGVGLLRELGIAVPTERSAAEIEQQIRHLYRWLDDTADEDERARPELTDPALLAATQLIVALVPALYFIPDIPLYQWLTLEGPRIWLEHGPNKTLAGLIGVAANAATVHRGENYAVGYHALRRIIALGDAHGYEPETSLVRSLFASSNCCWFEPIENAVRHAQQARQGLIAGGDLAWAGYAYQPSVTGLLECAPTLEVYLAEVDSGLAFLRRTGNEQSRQWLDSHRWLADTLRGKGGEALAAGDPIPADRHAGNPAAVLYEHIAHAIACAVFQDQAGLSRHAAAAIPLLPAALGLYPTAIAHLMHALALAEQARRGDDTQRNELLPAIDEVTRWLAVHATNAPDNFAHLLRFVEAERAWAAGDFRAALLAFDAALREVTGRNRPWHRALITERAAHFHLAHGADHAGHSLLEQAREAYAAWGATAKVAQLDWAHPTQRPQNGTTTGPGERAGDTVRQRSTVTTGTLDLLGILSASQALSSETSIERLHARVVEVLSAITGATAVHLLLWSDDHQTWLPTPGRDTTANHDVPQSVLRYVQRVREPLVVDDATRDDRFARSPYLAGATCCSLLALPVLSRGNLRAVLLLENRLIRGAFTTERLDAVKLIAAQLTVSLDNAQLYDELTTSRARIVAAADQTRRRIERDLHDGAQQRLIALAMQARMAQTLVPPGHSQLAAQLDALATEANRANDELRELAHGIHPAALATGGLQPALRALARRSAVPAVVKARVEGRLPEQIELAAYFAVAEALNNTAKHAHATTVTVVATVEDAVLHVQVSDDGHGGADIGGGWGLVGLKDRVESLGGRFGVQTAPGAGTTVHVELPLSRPAVVHG